MNTNETFESCGLKWLPCSPETSKPDWLPSEAKVRWLQDVERDGELTYVRANGTARWFFGTDIGPHIVGWYPVNKYLVPKEPAAASIEDITPPKPDETLIGIMLELSHDPKVWSSIKPSLRAWIRGILNDLEPARVRRIMQEKNDNNEESAQQ